MDKEKFFSLFSLQCPWRYKYKISQHICVINEKVLSDESLWTCQIENCAIAIAFETFESIKD